MKFNACQDHSKGTKACHVYTDNPSLPWQTVSQLKLVFMLEKLPMHDVGLGFTYILPDHPRQSWLLKISKIIWCGRISQPERDKN